MRQLLKRRQAIEPIIGHLKSDHRMNRCHLKGAQGDSLHAVLCAAGYNIRWLLRMIIQKGIGLFLRPFQAGVLGALAVLASTVMFAVLWSLFWVRKLVRSPNQSSLLFQGSVGV